MSPTTWNEVHVGDVVRGADMRAWTVIARGPAMDWKVSGAHAAFDLRLGEHTVTAHRALSQPCDLISRADHGPVGEAVNSLLSNEIGVHLVSETTTADPFTAPTVQVKRDRWGRYLLPDPDTGEERAWTRVTTLARTLADEYGLARWGERMVAKGMATREDLRAGAAAADPDRDKKTLDSIAQQAKDAAASRAGANLGTAFHQYCERLDRGESPCVEPPLDVDVDRYQRMLREHGLTVRPEWIERIVVCPELGVAGTLDRIVSQPRGLSGAAPLSVMDLKSGKSVHYSWLEIAIQQAVYARSAYLWNAEQGCYEQLPDDLDRDRALIAHVPIGKPETAALYAVSLIRGWEAAKLAVAVREARSGAKALAWCVDPEPEQLLLHQVRRATREELAALWERYQPAGLWSDEVNEAAQARMTELLGAAS